VPARWSRREVLGLLLWAGALGCRSARSDDIASTDQSASTSSADVPGGASRGGPSTTGASWDRNALDELVAFVEQRSSWAFTIVQNGSEVITWSASGTPTTRDVASVQKSVTSLLIGRAVQEGSVAVDETVASYLGADWTPAGTDIDITVRHLLTMTSGLDDRLARVAGPGEQWFYNTVAYSKLHDVLEAATAERLDGLAQRWLFDPIGAGTARFTERRAGASGASRYGLEVGAADLVGVGQLVLDGGTPLLTDRAWLDVSLRATQPFNRSYGYLWWLNGAESGLSPGPGSPSFPGPLVPAAPASMVAALGNDDQKLYVVPGDRLVVVRLGDRASPRGSSTLSTFDQELWERIAAART
jgi:CubicO group peptidase (beta-lactamase class C family)